MKHIEDTWPNKFKDEVWNLILSIAIDGVNPYSQPKNSYIFCHVVVINNNTPPWFPVKDEHRMSALIVPGIRQVKNMDVYLQLLIDECKQLWEGMYLYMMYQEYPL